MKQIYPRQEVADWLRQVISKTHSVDVSPEVSYAESQFGDFQTNVAMKLAKQLKSNPRDIAQPIADELDDLEGVESAEVAGPGFINVTLIDSYWVDYIGNIGHEFGRSAKGGDAKVQVEYISANPTGPLTLGNARGGFIGDVLSNVLASQGYKVTREYYFNDAGTQIQKLAESYRDYRSGSVNEETTYKGEYMEELAGNKDLLKAVDGGELQDRSQTRSVHSDNEDAIVETRDSLIAETVMRDYIKPALEKANITFDSYQKERDIVSVFADVREVLEQQHLIEERDGALWLKSTDLGDERDRVLVKSSGEHTYLANDIAYHYDIFASRGFDRSIKIWGADHAGQVPSLRLIVNRLFPEKDLEFLIVQWVRLIKEGQEFKISKRAGTYVTVEELVDRVGVDVARWFMLARSNDTHMDFDLDLAEQQSQKNPFWYVMYAYVRANSILQQAETQGLRAADNVSQLDGLEREITRELSRLPELLLDISASHEVHRLTFYGQELVKLFHEWYETNRVLELPRDKAQESLHFLQQYILAMDIYWQILGVEPYKEM